METKTKVSIARTNQSPGYEQIFAAVENAVDLIGGIGEFVKPGQQVLINPSWVSVVPKREQAAITLPEVTRAVADMVKNAGGAIRSLRNPRLSALILKKSSWSPAIANFGIWDMKCWT